MDKKEEKDIEREKKLKAVQQELIRKQLSFMDAEDALRRGFNFKIQALKKEAIRLSSGSVQSTHPDMHDEPTDLKPVKKKKNIIFPCCNDECDCHMFIGGNGKPCKECSSNLKKTKKKYNAREHEGYYP